MFGLKCGVELIDKLRNWASSYNAWVTILDDKGKPNNGPFDADRTMVTLDAGTLKPVEHFDFFLYGHFMKFIQRGAVRVESSSSRRVLAHVAFRNPDGQMVLVVVNPNSAPQSFILACALRSTLVRVEGKAVVTFLWSP